MPAKVAKQQKRSKNSKRHSNKTFHHPKNKSGKIKKLKTTNGHSTENDDLKITKNMNETNNETLTKLPEDANEETGKGNAQETEAQTQAQTDKEKEKEKEKNGIELLQRRRLHAYYLGEEFMSKHNFEMARVYFEQSLNREISTTDTKLPQLPNELDIYCKLLICRMHCDNSNTNLCKALSEVNYILSKIPNSVQHHIIRAELNIRTNNFENVGSCLLAAAESDQPNILDSVHLYFHQIAKNTTVNENDRITMNMDKHTDVDINQLSAFFEEMTLISQQNILSLEWEEIVEAIHSSLGDEIMTELFADADDSKTKFKTFLEKTLAWNLPQNEKQQSLIFLKVEFAYILAVTLWKTFKLPMPPPNESETKSMEDAIPMDCKPTYFLENGLFGCRDGFDFISAAIFEPSVCLSSIFDINTNNKKLLINHQWLYENGIQLLHWLSKTPLYHISEIVSQTSEGSKCSDSEWQKFMQTRINAHYAIDPELNETVLSRDAHEDGKKFEDAIEQIVGKQKKNHLMQLELDLSIPILKKYAHIMAQISGIDEDILIYELTLPDEDDTENDSDEKEPALTSSLLKDYLNNPKFADYKPVGLPVLVQNAEFNIIPTSCDGTNKHYDRSHILSSLSALEKEVVQFQIDYKNQVYAVAGDKANELDKVMSTLQYRGLELTKWLRNFVKYMIARRDIEQEIVDVSQKSNHKDAMNWFESMTNYLNGANNILLKIISKLFVNNLIKSSAKYDRGNTSNEEKQQSQYEKYELYPGKKIEKLSSRYFELDCMVKFYVSIKKQFESVMLNEKFENISEAETFVKEVLLKDEKVCLRKNEVLSSLNMSCIKIPMLEIAIPATIIENQYGTTYKSWIRYPLTQTYVEKTKLFIERCKYLRDNILCIIYSSVEKRCLLYPTLHTSPNKYFKCIGCQKIYAQLLCKNCNLAHYCSIQCQHQHWDKFHKRECKKYANLSNPTVNVMLK
eukprot:111414_1